MVRGLFFKAVLATSLIFNHHVSALQVTPGSACASVCLDNPGDNHNDPTKSTTTPKDIVCQDTKYITEAAGKKYQNCMQCLKTSHFVNGTESDSAWWFYNLRYTVDVCLYGKPNISTQQVVSSPCNTEYACGPFEKALQVGILDPTKAATFDYCEADGGVFTGPRFGSCVKCLQSSSEQSYMANFMIALKGGCDKRPNPQSVLQLSSSVFSTSQVEVVDPAATTAASQDSSAPGMTTAAIAGIAVGAGLLLLGGTALFWIYHRRQKRMYRLETPTPRISISYPRMGPAGMPPPFSGPAMSMHSKNGSVASTLDMHKKTVPIITHENHHRQLEDGSLRSMPVEVSHTMYNIDPHQVGNGSQVVLPTHPAYIPRAMSRANTTHDPPSPSPITPFEDDYIPTPAEEDHAQTPKGSRFPQYQTQPLQQLPLVQQPLPPHIQIHPPAEAQPQMRPPEHWSLHPPMSDAARARIAAYVMNDENSHPLVPGESLPQKPAAVLPAGENRRPSPPALRNQHQPPSMRPSVNTAPVTGLLSNGMPPPPPPPASTRAVQLGTPSAPKLRTAKQYVPPSIKVPPSDAFMGLSPTDSTVTIGLDLGTPGLSTPGLSTPGLPTPLLRRRWANETTAGVGLPPVQVPEMTEHHYSSSGWRAQNGAMNFSNPYRSNSVNNNSNGNGSRLPDRSKRETQFEDLETPQSGVEMTYH